MRRTVLKKDECKLKISIITICYNNENDIRSTIESVINQDYKNIEYIVIDGKSTDNSVNIIQEYKDKISKFVSENDKNLYDAINKGIKLASGDIVGLIHAGDRLFDNRVISKVANHFNTYNIDGLYGHSYIVDENDKPVRINKSPEFKRSLFKIGWMPSHQSIYIKKDIIEKNGYYSLELHPMSDYEFVLRHFYFNDINVKLLDEFIIKFSMGGISTKNYWHNLRTQKKQLICWKVNGETPPFYLIPLKLFRKVKQFTSAYFFNLKQQNAN